MTPPAEEESPQRALPAEVRFLEAIGAAARVFKSNLASLTALYLGTAIVLAVIQESAGFGYSRLESGSAGAVSLALLFRLLLPSLIASILVGVTAVLLADRIAGIPRGLGEALAAVRSRWREVLATALFPPMLSLVISFLPLLFLFVPVLFGPPVLMHVVVLEQMRFQKAWTRTRMLWAGHFGRLLMNLFTVALGAQLLILFIASGLFGALDATTDLTQHSVDLIAFSASALLVWVMTAFLSVLSLVFYFDLRVRHEDFGPDELRAERTTG